MNYVSKIGSVLSAALLLAGCDGTFSAGTNPSVPPPVVIDDAAAQGGAGIRPAARPATLQTTSPKPARSARTAEQFDTTTNEQRAEAVAVTPVGGERKLGATVGSLGNPAEPGFWLKTPLVSVAGKGRVEYPENGKSVAVDLVPIDGPKTAGSRVSLAALRLLGAPLTGLPDLIVYAE
jgi:hypothetical protein